MSEFVTIECANCGIPFGLEVERRARLLETHATFYCPNGHPNVYRGKSESERKIERLERFLADARRDRDERYAESDDCIGALKSCPLRCGWRSHKQMRRLAGEEAFTRGLLRIQADVIDHLIGEHDLKAPDEVRGWLAEVAR